MSGSEKFYFTAGEAATELKMRMKLRAQIEDWWNQQGWGNPDFLGMLPANAAVLARHVATARYEDIVFSQLAISVGLEPVWIEYLNDKFSDRSDFKRSLLKRCVFKGRGKRSGQIISINESLVKDMTASVGLKLNQIQTSAGGNLVERHHQQHALFFPKNPRFDISNWYAKAGPRAVNYYPALLSFFIAHAVLFEDYHGGESGAKLGDFTEKVFTPAWQNIETTFGTRPLIVPLPWRSEFSMYPEKNDWRNHGIIPPEYC